MSAPHGRVSSHGPGPSRKRACRRHREVPRDPWARWPPASQARSPGVWFAGVPPDKAPTGHWLREREEQALPVGAVGVGLSCRAPTASGAFCKAQPRTQDSQRDSGCTYRKCLEKSGSRTELSGRREAGGLRSPGGWGVGRATGQRRPSTRPWKSLLEAQRLPSSLLWKPGPVVHPRLLALVRLSLQGP